MISSSHLNLFPSKTSVGPNHLNRKEPAKHRFQKLVSTFGIGGIGISDFNHERNSRDIDSQMPFMPFDSFISIKTSTISQFRGFDGLTINHCKTGFGSSAHFYSGWPMEKGVNQEPSLVFAPFTVVVINILLS